MINLRRVFLVGLLGTAVSSAFVPHARNPWRTSSNRLWGEGKSQRKGEDKTIDPFTKASWFAVEAFGKVFGSKKSAKESSVASQISLEEPPQSLEETLTRIRLDNDRDYFLSGEVDKLIYDEDCVFADPFVAFSGRDRFVENLANLGSFVTKYSARVLDYTEEDEAVKTKIMVKLQLNLPWSPVLAWPWGVSYEIDPETYLIVRHEENWDIEPWEGVKQIFRKPTVQV